MDEYINREDALKIIDSYSKACTEEGKIVADAIRDIIAVITPTADVAPKSEVASMPHKCKDCAGCTQWKCDCANIELEVARGIFEEIKRSKVTLGYPAKIICFRATPTGEVEETVEGWVVPQSRIEELEKKYIGGKTDEDISD
jgi:hypothetical protein